MEVGAIQVPLNPKLTAAELAGFVQQVDPALIVTDAALAPLVDVGGAATTGSRPRVVDVDALYDGRARRPRARPRSTSDDVAVMIPTSGTTGRSKLVMQTHLAYVMAGEGFPFWMQLTRRRPADDVAARCSTSTRPRTRRSVRSRARAEPRAAAAASRRARSSTTRRRFGATEFNSIGAMLEILVRQPERPDDADNPIRLCYTGPSPDREHQLEIEERFGFEIVCGYALSESPYALIWRHGDRPYGTLGSPRQHPSSAT